MDSVPFFVQSVCYFDTLLFKNTLFEVILGFEMLKLLKILVCKKRKVYICVDFTNDSLCNRPRYNPFVKNKKGTYEA